MTGYWLPVTDLQPVWDWFRALHESTGINLTIFYDTFDRARFFNAHIVDAVQAGIGQIH